MRKVAIGQAGGPTAVMNASLVGFLENTEAEIYCVPYGYEGVVNGSFISLAEYKSKNLFEYKNIPGACLGSGRFRLSDDDFVQAVNNLKKKDIQTIVFIGGNGTMWAQNRLSEVAKNMGYNLQVIGIPKTVDNDLAGTDHAPGYGSAARYVSLATRDISKDLEAMKNFEQVRVIETMGRNVGWLAAASGLFKEHEVDGPHKIYLPEQSLTSEKVLADAKETVKEYGFATLVVSEGVSLDNKSKIEKAVVGGRSVLGGISQEVAELIRTEAGLMARDEVLGMNQRSSQVYTSKQDRIEAYEVGKKAAEIVELGISNIMVAITRTKTVDYEYSLTMIPLKKVSDGGERSIPIDFIEQQDSFYEWLRPLVGSNHEHYPPSFTHQKVGLK